jgi:hypothetical protein
LAPGTYSISVAVTFKMGTTTKVIYGPVNQVTVPAP